MKYENSLEELHLAMEACLQAPNLNMLQHGQLVHEKYKELIDELEKGEAPTELQQIYSKFSLPPASVLQPYHVYHDCGKHLTLTIDEDGKRHFPDHANISAQQYSHLFPDDLFTTNLIRRDMDFHTARGDELLELIKHPLAPILFFTAWAEINANASMFGGKDSQSYKIKTKRLIQAAKKFLK
jgi:hypothetical protein